MSSLSQSYCSVKLSIVAKRPAFPRTRFEIGIWDLYVLRGQISLTPMTFEKLWTTPGVRCKRHVLSITVDPGVRLGLDLLKSTVIDSVPQVVQVACHHSNAQTNKPLNRDGRVVPLIFPLHNADKTSADPPIG